MSSARLRTAQAILLAGALTLPACLTSPPQRALPQAAVNPCYDYNTYRVSEQAEIFRKAYGSYVLHCDGSFVDEEGESFKFHLRGIASPITVRDSTYLLAAGHVFDLAREVSLRGGSPGASAIRPPAYYVELNGRRYAMERLDAGTHDLALFRLRGGEPLPRSSYACGDSDDLRPGNPVLSWGLPLLEDFELSVGIVSSLSAPRSLLEASFPEAEAEDFFVTSMPSIFGCSGALVYAFRNGTPEIVGMLVAGYVNINRSIVYKINSILKDSGLEK
jgi:S1-C subfamily serine protease